MNGREFIYCGRRREEKGKTDGRKQEVRMVKNLFVKEKGQGKKVEQSKVTY